MTAQNSGLVKEEISSEGYLKPYFEVRNHYQVSRMYPKVFGGEKIALWEEVKDFYYFFFNMPQEDLEARKEKLEIKREKAKSLIEKVKEKEEEILKKDISFNLKKKLIEDVCKKRVLELERIMQNIDDAAGFYYGILREKAEKAVREKLILMMLEHQKKTSKYQQQPIVHINSEQYPKIEAFWQGNSLDIAHFRYVHNQAELEYFEEK